MIKLKNLQLKNNDTGYPHGGRANMDSYQHNGRADKDSYPHDGRADKDSYPHDRHNQYIILTLLLLPFIYLRGYPLLDFFWVCVFFSSASLNAI